jgi:hypothetical protein
MIFGNSLTETTRQAQIMFHRFITQISLINKTPPPPVSGQLFLTVKFSRQSATGN